MRLKADFLLCVFLMVCATANAREKGFIYDDDNKRDPLWPLVSSTGSIINYNSDYVIADLLLEGVMLGESSDKSLAIINGRIIKISDKIGAYEVKAITTDTVTLEKEQQEFTIRLKKED